LRSTKANSKLDMDFSSAMVAKKKFRKLKTKSIPVVRVIAADPQSPRRVLGFTSPDDPITR